MKKTLFLIGIATAMFLFSCKKNTADNPVPITPKKPTITLVTPSGGEVFRAGESITVTWESSDLPVGSVIIASIGNTSSLGSTMGYYMHSKDELPIYYYDKNIPAVANRGTAVFQIPDDSSDLYHYIVGYDKFEYGNKFRLGIAVAYPVNGKWTMMDAKSLIIESSIKNAFSVMSPYNTGCYSYNGYSSTTGKPCSVPDHD